MLLCRCKNENENSCYLLFFPLQSEKGVPPPGAIVSARRMELDPRAEPQYGERVPYVVVYSDPGARLTDQVVEPKELLLNKDLRLNGEYYIRKQIIPSLERIFQLAGADVKSWYDEMPRVHRAAGLPLTGPGSINVPAAGPSSRPSSRSGSRPGEVAPLAAAAVVPTEATGAMVAAQQHHQDTMRRDAQAQHHPAGGAAADFNMENGGDDCNVGGGSDDRPGGMTGPEPGALDTNISEALSKPPRFIPRRRGGKSFVSLGPRIDRYYQSQLCVLCSKLMGGQKLGKDLCGDCTSEQNRVKSMVMMQNRLSKAEKLVRATVDICSSCCRSSPITGGGSGGGGLNDTDREGDTELVACESLECNVFWQRRKAQDSMMATRHLTERVIKELEELELLHTF